jgi:exosome complex RNA-binding protein Rrp4
MATAREVEKMGYIWVRRDKEDNLEMRLSEIRKITQR